MNASMIPFNISLLVPKKEDLNYIIPITSMDTMEPSSKNFAPNGLFSTEIFGKVGEEKRNRLFSYIDLKITVFHPVIFKALHELKHIYSGIILGREYAIWNDEIKDFEKSTFLEGQTGFHFFAQHFEKIVFAERKSAGREHNIKLVEKYKKDCLVDKLVVMPAGLRDYEFDENGQPTEGEINTKYRKMLSLSNLVADPAAKAQPDAIDGIRAQIQVTFNEIYEYFTGLLEGKRKLIQGKVVTRKIFNTTRNVATSLSNTVNTLDSPQLVDQNSTVVGLYQYLKSIVPVAVHQLKIGFLSKVFVGSNSPAYLVNKKTLKKEMVNIDPSDYDRWMTSEGLRLVITNYGEEDLRHTFLEVEDHYLGLIYLGPDNTFALFQDIDDLPKERSRKDVRPITFSELLYASVYEHANEMTGLVTRYPVTGYGSIYPCNIYLKSTVKGQVREELTDSFEKTGKKAIEFPIYQERFVNSMSPSISHLKRLGLDYDGDTVSLAILFTDDAKAEIKAKLNSAAYYVGPSGKMNFSINSDVANYVVSSLTRPY